LFFFLSSAGADENRNDLLELKSESNISGKQFFRRPRTILIASVTPRNVDIHNFSIFQNNSVAHVRSSPVPEKFLAPPPRRTLDILNFIWSKII